MEVFDLKPFSEFIQKRKLVPEKYLAYYVGWVRRFLQTEIPSVINTEKDRLRCFRPLGTDSLSLPA